MEATIANKASFCIKSNNSFNQFKKQILLSYFTSLHW